MKDQLRRVDSVWREALTRLQTFETVNRRRVYQLPAIPSERFTKNCSETQNEAP